MCTATEAASHHHTDASHNPAARQSSQGSTSSDHRLASPVVSAMATILSPPSLMALFHPAFISAAPRAAASTALLNSIPWPRS